MQEKQLKILFIGDTYHPNSMNWVTALENYGHCRVIKWSLPKRGSKIKRIIDWLFAIQYIKKLSKELQPDIVVGYRITSYGYLVSGIRDFPVVIAAQGETDVWPPYGFMAKIVGFLAKCAIRRADLIHAWGPHMANSMYRLGAKKEKIWIMPRGIDLNIFKYPHQPIGFEALKIVVSRSLNPEYRHAIIIDAVKILFDMNIPVTIRIVGDGPLMQLLYNKVIALGLSNNVIFEGILDRSKLVKVLQSSNIYVSMPITEGVSASMLEAMACGCVPCVTDLEANQYWIKNNENGMLIPVDDTKSLSNALMNIYYNSNKFSTIRHNNRYLVEQKASAEINTIKMVERYKSLINEKKVAK